MKAPDRDRDPLQTVARMRAVAAEIDALYALRTAAEEAIRLEDFGPIRRALTNLTIAERVRRGTP
jgi:hypothetical protein